jgi:hypothetical protein
MTETISVIVRLPINVHEARVLLEGIEALQERIRRDEYPADPRDIEIDAFQNQNNYACLRVRLITNQ